MSDTEKQVADVDYIAIIKAAKEHGVLSLKIGNFELTFQVPSLSSVSQWVSAPRTEAIASPNSAYNAVGTSTAEFAAVASKLEKIHKKRQQFDDFRNLKPPAPGDDSGEGES